MPLAMTHLPFQTKPRLSLLGLCLCLGLTLGPASFARGQDEAPEEESFYDSIPEEIREREASFFTFTLENDLFGNGQDRNYTNGVRLTYFDYSADIPEFAHQLDRMIPTFAVNETTSIYYSLGQNLYTPTKITSAVPDPADRPYAAFLYGSAGLTSLSDNHIDELEATLGLVGPLALGEPVQRAVHKLINGDTPSGWAYQLDNEPGLILSWQRRWPGFYARDFDGFTTRLIPHGGMTLGNIYTYANSGVTFQLTPTRYKWQSTPLRVRPSIPGNGFFAVPDDRFAWSVFLGAEGRAVGRNIFLDGNTFADSPSVDKRYFVADLSGGLALSYGHTQFSYTLNWRSREFRGQDDQSLFGALSISRRF